jgi:hypothetical protein
MTPEAKKLLSSTVRALRARLLGDLQAAMEGEYRLGVARVRDAGLGEAAARKRARLEAWLDEQLRAQGAGGKGKQARTREDFRREVEQQAAYTLLNRLVVLRLMEASGLRREPVATRGWESSAYKTLRELAPALAGRRQRGLCAAAAPGRRGAGPGPAGPVRLRRRRALVPVPCRHHPAPRGRGARPAGPRLVLDRRHDPRLGLSVLERPRARGPRRQAQRPRQARAPRDRQQDPDVHRALHGGLAAAEQPRADVAGDVCTGTAGPPRPRRTARSRPWRRAASTGAASGSAARWR